MTIELTVAQEHALLGWLADQVDDDGTDDDTIARLRRQLAEILEGLPERLRDYLEKLLALPDARIESSPALAVNGSTPSPRPTAPSWRRTCDAWCAASTAPRARVGGSARAAGSTAAGPCARACATTACPSGR